MPRTRNVTGVAAAAPPSAMPAAYAAGDAHAGYAAPRWTPFALVFAAVSFNLVLCFLNTGVIGVSNLHVIGCEAAIVALTLLYASRMLGLPQLLLLAGIVLWTLSLSALRVVLLTDDAFDIKIVRDLVIPFAFFLLGLRVADLKTADFVVRLTVVLVLAFALFEYFALDAFVKIFSVAKYYVARGTMEARQALQSADLFVSGIRPAGAQGGRNLLPFLGDHRVSSLFLEPVSLGNFGVIVAIWAMVRAKFSGTLQLGVMLAALALIVLADSRFGAYLCILAFVLLLCPAGLATAAALSLPLVALVVLILVPALVTGSYDPQNRYVDNGFVGRFVLAAQILGDFDVLTWLGLRAARMQTFDSGYAYVVSGIGIAGLAALWALLFAVKGPGRQYDALRNLFALYFATILCVSNSPFTIKTAALMWFLLGIAAAPRALRQAAPDAAPRRSPPPRLAVVRRGAVADAADGIVR